MTATAAPRRRSGRTRIGGIDLARGLAIVGMVAVHVLPGADRLVGLDATLYRIPGGRASTLFAIVAGIGIGILLQRDPVALVRGRLLYRAVWLIPLGLALQALDHPIAVILQYYGLWFALTALVVGWRPAPLAWLTGVGVVVGPALMLAVTGGPDPLPAAVPDLGPLGELLVTGFYPTLSWWWLVLAGILLARLELRETGVQLRLVLGGGALALLGYGIGSVVAPSAADPLLVRQLATTAHADTTLETLAAGGLAVAVLGLCLLAVDAAPRVSWPGVALGRLALSVYVGHVVLYAASPSVLRSASVAEAVRTLVVFTVATAAGSALWLWPFRRGPLEAVVRAGWRPLRHMLELTSTGPPGPPAPRDPTSLPPPPPPRRSDRSSPGVLP